MHYGRKRCAKGHFGLAETHVSAYEPVHRSAGCQVVEDLFDGAFLVVREAVRKARRKSAHFRERRAHGGHLARGPLCLQVEQFRRHVPQLLLGPSLDAGPGIRTEAVQRRVLGIPAGIAGDELHVRHRNVETIVAGIAHPHELGGRAAHVHVLQAFVAADTMIFVDHRRAGGQVRQTLQDGLGIRLSPAPAAGQWPLPAEQFTLGQDDKIIRQRDAAIERALGKAQGGP